jgi:hypothetical protein
MTRHVDLDALVLKRGKHDRRKDGVDIMEAVAWFAGEEHSDHPKCASEVIAAGMRSLNDDWDDAARQQLKAYVPLLVGSNALVAVELRRAWMALDSLVREHTPAWLRAVGAGDEADLLTSATAISDAATADKAFPLLDQAIKEATIRWGRTGGGMWEEARAAIGASGGVALWRVVAESRKAESAAIDAARATSGQAAAAATAAGGDLDAVVAKLQASTLELFRRMIATTGG